MTFSNFNSANKFYGTYYVPQKSTTLRNKAYEHSVSTSDKIQAGIGSVVGTAIPLVLMMRRQKVKNPLKLHYGLKDMVIVSGSAVAGGVAVGMIGDTKQARKNKFKEGVFQFMNATIPTWIVSVVLELSKRSSKLNNVAGKIGSLALGLVVGMFGTATAANLIFDPKDKVPDRKLTIKDCLVNLDDALGALVLARIPFVDKLHLESVLPAIYAYCGYRAGKSN